MDNIENRQIRIFISSTFLDMQEERKYLIDEIFPILREKAMQRDVSLTALDLRWGIPQRLTENGKVIEICMNEIDNSHPFFIGLIGKRYGWRPSLSEYDNNDNLKDRFSMLKRYFMEGLSVTEMEMRYAALERSRNNLEKHKINAYFYIKNTITEGSIEEIEKLENLKKNIRKSPFPVYDYKLVKEIGNQVLHDFEELLEKYFPFDEQEQTPLQQERNRQQAYRNNLCRIYIGNEYYIHQLNNFLVSDEQGIIVVGESGIGKSALLAKWLKLHETEEDYIVIYHFVGNGEAECNHFNIVDRIINEIKDQFNLVIDSNEEREESQRSFDSRLDRMFKRIPANKRLLIVVDGINQISDIDDSKLLSWLPAPPQNVKYVISTLESDSTFLALQRMGFNPLIIESLGIPRRKELIKKYLKSYSKELDDENQVLQIASDPQNANTLVLKTLLDELISVGQHDKMDHVIAYYLNAKNIEDFFQLVIQRFTSGENKEWIRDALMLIALSHKGLSENEIIGMTGVYQLYWSSFYCAFKNHFIIRNGLITFSHQYLRKVVDNIFLRDENKNIRYRDIIIRYFEPSDTNRSYNELSFQYYKCEYYEKLYEMIFDYNTFSYLYDTDRTQLIQYWKALEKEDNIKYNLRSQIMRQKPLERNSEWIWINYRLRLMHFIEFVGKYELLIQSTEDLEQAYITKPQWVELLETKAHYYTVNGDIEKAIDLYNKALLNHEDLFPYEPSPRKIFLRNKLGGLYITLHQLNLALEQYKSALIMAKELNVPSQISVTCSNIAYTYSKMGDNDNQKKYDLLSLQYAKAPEGSNTHDGAVALCNVAIVEWKNSKFKSAHNHLHQALQIFKNIYGENGLDVARTYNMIGTCYCYRGLYNIAIACKMKALKMYSDLFEDQYEIASIIKDIAINYENLNDWDNSICYYFRAIIRYARVGDNIEVARIYSKVALCYECLELFNKSLKAASLAMSIVEKHPMPLSVVGELKYVLGICYYNLYDIKNAKNCFSEALDDILASDQHDNEAVSAITEMLSICKDQN